MMKCKNCGGEILFQNGISRCQNCGSTFSTESIYENIDVYLCYNEADVSGRRTKDSLVAQEVYNKLEAAKIKVFYERISADNVAGNSLEAVKCSAIQKSRVILLLGTSVECFSTLAEKYASLLVGKTVIPFCIDVNPGDIPKNISKIQAVSYNTIGWEKDLITGLYNLLEKEEDINSTSLYSNTRKKKTLIISILSTTIVLCIVAVLVFGLVGKNKNSVLQTETAQLSQQEIYDQALSLLDQGKFIDSLNLFMKIPQHPDSTNRIKLIYSKYEGYYQKDDISIRLDITDNVRADIEVDIVSGANPIHFSMSTDVVGNIIEGSYQDNLKQSGKITFKLEDSGLNFTYNIDGTSTKKEIFFEFSQKSDQQISQIDADIILSWLKKKHTITQLNAMGYELEEVSILDRAGRNRIYKIKDTDIYLHMYSSIIIEQNFLEDYDEMFLLGVDAPAEVLIPSYIGKSTDPFFVGDLLYWPNAITYDNNSYFTDDYATSSDKTISKTTNIGITSKNILPTWRWSKLQSDVAQRIVDNEVQKKYKLDSYDGTFCVTIAENQTHFLIAAEITSDQSAWYKYSKKDQKVIFIKEGPFQTVNGQISEDLWFSEYLDFALEFPETFDIKPGSDEWNEKVVYSLQTKVVDTACEKYNLYDGVEFVMQAENNNHILIAIRIDDKTCAWYRAGKIDGKVAFVKEGPTESEYIGYISEEFWNSQYPEFAAEFPDAFQQ